jgi:hypothetical protein
MKSSRQFFWLRVALLFSALVWGVSAYGVFARWENVVTALKGLGAGTLPDDPMLDYWLRMAAGAFTLVGTGYLLVALQPRKYAVMLPWFGWIMIGEGIVLLSHGLRLGLGPLPFAGDVSACFGGGLGILLTRRAAAPA